MQCGGAQPKVTPNRPTQPTSQSYLMEPSENAKKKTVTAWRRATKFNATYLQLKLYNQAFFWVHFHRSFSEMGAAQNFYSKLPKRLANSLLDFCRQLAASGNEKFDRTCNWSFNIFPSIWGYILIILIRALDVRFLFFRYCP